MSANKFTEGLTRENAAVVFVDHQVGLYSGVRDIPLGELKHNVVALAKAARVLKLPLVVTTTAARSMWGPTIPELAEALPPGLEIIYRSTVNAWDEPRVKAAIQPTGGQKLIITGILRHNQVFYEERFLKTERRRNAVVERNPLKQSLRKVIVQVIERPAHPHFHAAIQIDKRRGERYRARDPNLLPVVKGLPLTDCRGGKGDA